MQNHLLDKMVRGGRSEVALATVYQKHSSVLTLKEDVYRMTPARCRKVKGKG